jgi:site-specific recombinase XerD
MNIQSMQSIVDSMLSQYKAYGITESSYISYRDSYCSLIIRFCEQNNGGIYSPATLDAFLAVYTDKLAKKEIGITYYSIIERIVRLLKSVAETGTADFSMKKPAKQYNPSPEHWSKINDIIESNNISPGSVKNLQVQIRHIFCFIEEQGIDDKDLTDNVFFDFLSSISNSHKGCMGEIMRAIRLTTSYLKANGSEKLQTDFSLLPIKKAAVRMIPAYSHDEIKRIVDAIDITSALGKRDYAILLLAFDTGLRGIDIIKLKLHDIDWRAGTLSVKQSKTKQPVTQVLKGVVLNAIADYILDSRPENGEREVFLSTRPPYKALCGSYSLDTMIEKYCRLAGVPKKSRRSFHSVRRAFATELSLKGVALGEISELLGHRKIRSDKPYLSYDKKHVAFVSGDFSEIPLVSGIYASMLNAERGDQ